jgi:hypothetical protein
MLEYYYFSKEFFLKRKKKSKKKPNYYLRGKSMVGVDIGLQGEVSPFNKAGRDLGLHSELGNAKKFTSQQVGSSTDQTTKGHLQNSVLDKSNKSSPKRNRRQLGVLVEWRDVARNGLNVKIYAEQKQQKY